MLVLDFPPNRFEESVTGYLSYWKPGTAENELDAGGEVWRSASDQYGKVTVGDRVYIVTVWPTGDLILLGRIVVGELLERGEAHKKYGSENLWDAKWYIVGVEGTAMPINEIDISGVASLLRFMSKLDRLDVSDGSVNAQQLQTIRALTPDSCVILDERIAQFQDAAASLDKFFKGDGQGFGSAETNKLVEVKAVEVVTLHFQSKGWTVVSHESKKCGYDLYCSRESEVLCIEVKGTSSVAPGFIITSNEVDSSSTKPDWRLALVTEALSLNPKLFVFDADQMDSMFVRTPLAFRMSPRIDPSRCEIL
jgi:hypothetical protein